MTETNRSNFKKRAAALAVASCLSVMPWVAEAAGLGKITVFSGLGQPLRAELEIAANRDEVIGMAARLAPADAFSQAGIEYAPALRDLRFSVEKRGNGQPVVKVTSFRPINEPFLDFLVELNWPSGRLVREYTFLLDPPEIGAKASSAPVSVAEAKVVETLRGRDVRQPAPAPAPTPAAPRQVPPAKIAPEASKQDGSKARIVQTGENLRKIAGENQYEGVSLEQMLVGLFQSNPDAFMGKNINRLKAGAILGIPEKSTVESIPEAEAKKVYVAHASDWNAYRQKLAAGVAKAPVREDAAAAQATSGKITAKVQEKAAPTESSKDQVKVSRTELAAKGAPAGKAGASGEVEQIAKDKALREAQGRLSSLEKNVDELQKLLDLKSKKLAELQQQPAAKKEEVKPVEAVKPVEPAKVEAPKPVEVVKPAEEVKPVDAPKEAEPVKPVEATPPAEAAKPVEPAKPSEPVKPAEPLSAEDAEVEEPGFMDALLSNPLALLGGGGVLALIAAFFVARRRRPQGDLSPETTTAPSPSSLGPNSVFRMTGGQSIDTSNVAPQTGDFSQTGPGSIDTDEVDPVAEADVYMAYGRDTQAEEILLEALQKDPQRTAIHAKLLEIYANRKSVKQFETLASELYAQTAGVGPEWEKVAELGASLDPENPLYSGARSVVATAFAADATLRAPSGEAHPVAEMAESEPTFELDAELASLVEPAESPSVLAEPEDVTDELTGFDFSIDVPAVEPESPVETAVEVVAPVFDEPYIDTLVSEDANVLDFDLGVPEPPAEPVSEVIAELPAVEDSAHESLDFNLESEPGKPDAIVAEETVDASPDFSPEGTMLMPSGMEDVGVSTYIGMDASPAAPVAEPAQEQAVELAEQSLGDFDFDLDSPSSTQTVVNPLPESLSSEFFDGPSAVPDIEIDNPQLAATVIGPDADSLEFDVKLTDSVFLGQPMMPPDFDIGSINLDLAAEPSSQEAEQAAVEASPVAEPVADEEFAKDAHWEQVNTKLDLAKAYEEMGDLEGARELLQEVVGEGSADLVEQAHAILGRIGE